MKNNKFMKVSALALSMLLIASCGGNQSKSDTSKNNGDNGDTSSVKEQSQDAEKTVSSIAMKTLPAKTKYYVGEEFSPDGAELEVTYSDSSTVIKSLTDEGVEYSKPNMARTGTKTITVKYGGKKTTFKIEVKVQGLTVTFDLNYEGAPEGEKQDVTSGYSATEPTTPTRSGYTFYKWYADKDCTVEYDMDTPVKADTTVYAMWKEDGKTYYTFNYDVNYYGVKHSTYEQIVQSGDKPRALGITLSRVDYSFVEWSSSADGSSIYDMNEAITKNTVAYAKWQKTKEGVTTYLFEAEDVDLSQKAGPGYSGENAGIGMIVTKTGIGASQDKFVAYQCKNGNSLEFYIASDEELHDVTLVTRFAAEYASMTLTPEDYKVYVNGESLDYDDITLTLKDGESQSQFQDYTVGANLTLKKGANLIQLKTTNNKELGGTLTATAPIIDCIKVSTEGVVTWDGVYGLPSANY